MRGNYFGISLLIFCNSGSPPRARELLIMIENSTVDQGITPACAGITGIGGIKELLARGSPPRARELRFIISSFDLKLGITPACAGITFARLTLNHYFWDHPRVRGNCFFCINFAYSIVGSPPRVRELLSANTLA